MFQWKVRETVRKVEVGYRMQTKQYQQIYSLTLPNTTCGHSCRIYPHCQTCVQTRQESYLFNWSLISSIL